MHDLLRSGELVPVSPITGSVPHPYRLIWSAGGKRQARVQGFAHCRADEGAAYLAEAAA